MYSYLQNNPHVGIISGISSGTLLSIQDYFTNEEVLKIVAGIAGYAGCGVAVLSLFVWLIKVYDLLKIRLKK